MPEVISRLITTRLRAPLSLALLLACNSSPGDDAETLASVGTGSEGANTSTEDGTDESQSASDTDDTSTTDSGTTTTSAGTGGMGEFALDFDGENDVVWIDDADLTALDSASNITVEAWIRPADLNVHPRIVDRSDTQNNDRFILALDSDEQGVQFNINGQIARGGDVPSGRWNHLAGTYDGEFIRVFVNGELIDEIAYSGALSVTDSPMTIGDDLNNVRPFRGWIDDVRIWNVARTQEQVAMDALDYGTEAHPGLVYLFEFDEGEGEIATDVINGVQATLGHEMADAYPLWINSEDHPFPDG